MTIRDGAEPVAPGGGGGGSAIHWLYALVLLMACNACGGDRLRSTGSDTAGRERSSETVFARLANLALSPERPVSLHDVVATRRLVGRRVKVVGRCSSQFRVPERPAGSRETWQLEGDGVTVLVVGSLPNACTARREPTVTITALVAEDTLAAIGDLPGAPRRYLVLVDTR